MKSYIKNHLWANKLLEKIYRLWRYNRISIKGRGNQYDLNVLGLFIAHSRIVINGNNNKLIFLPNSSFARTQIM